MWSSIKFIKLDMHGIQNPPIIPMETNISKSILKLHSFPFNTLPSNKLVVTYPQDLVGNWCPCMPSLVGLLPSRQETMTILCSPPLSCLQ